MAKSNPRDADYQDAPIVPPPDSVTVDHHDRPILYDDRGTPLRRPIGFVPPREK